MGEFSTFKAVWVDLGPAITRDVEEALFMLGRLGLGLRRGKDFLFLATGISLKTTPDLFL